MTLCPTCNKPEMVYGSHTALECSLNLFQTKVDEQKLRFTPLDDVIRSLMSAYPALVERLTFAVPNGRLTGVFVSRKILEVISMYHDTGADYMTLPEYLSALGVTE